MYIVSTSARLYCFIQSLQKMAQEYFFFVTGNYLSSKRSAGKTKEVCPSLKTPALLSDPFRKLTTAGSFMNGFSRRTDWFDWSVDSACVHTDHLSQT